ncbi:zf-TFIIB domain-containing protein [Saliphagus sp. GCM10025308]|uniref:Zf-TFIIB domain-containing protein n=1 Tax=Natronosalvus rutilus TaxID=2953753 RepID=A0A9E7SU09_9EURY|nr:zf-TFIIB domain-containing protein [Natronosalvus rutilus]UTF53065.1 zf-TFIIB domain-containing protein [Natronosalvus rutilus]
MDDCPRCQAPLERLTLGEVTTIACSRCGFADVPVEHESREMAFESWQDAFNRFYET